MFLGFQRGGGKSTGAWRTNSSGGGGGGGGGGGPSTNASTNTTTRSSSSSDVQLMLSNIDKDINLLWEQCCQYETSITQLQQKIEGNMVHFREAAQSLSAISESFGGGLGSSSGGGVSADACEYMNATTLIATEAISDFEEALRQHVLSTMEYIASENRRIEEKMKARLNLLKQHDAAFRAMVRARATTNTSSSGDNSTTTPPQEDSQAATIASLRAEFFALQDQIKQELGSLLRERVNLYQKMLAKLSQIQLRLFAKMYNALGKSLGYEAEVPPPPAVSEEGGSGKDGEKKKQEEERVYECKGGVAESKKQEKGEGNVVVAAVMVEGAEGALQATASLVVEAAGERAAEATVEENSARAEAVALCEQQVIEEEEAAAAAAAAAVVTANSSSNNAASGRVRRLPSLFLSAATSPTSRLAAAAATAAGAPLPTTNDSVASLSSPDAILSPVPLASCATGAGTLATGEGEGGGGGRGGGAGAATSKFNLDIFRKLLPGPRAGGGGGGGGRGGSGGGAGAGAGGGGSSGGAKKEGVESVPDDSKEGWLRLEQDFQASLLKAALKASFAGMGRMQQREQYEQEQQQQQQQEQASASTMAGGMVFDWMSRTDTVTTSPESRNGYLASLAHFKAFNLPFTLVGKALESPPLKGGSSGGGGGTAPAMGTTQQFVEWSLKKDADKYRLTAQREETATLQSFLLPWSSSPSSSSSAGGVSLPPTVTPAPASSSSTTSSSSSSSPSPTSSSTSSSSTIHWLGASLRFLDVVGLAQASEVNKEWEHLLMHDSRGQEAWKQAVRRGGVPERVRARLWQYLIYSTSIPWRPIPNASNSSSSSSNSTNGSSQSKNINSRSRVLSNLAIQASSLSAAATTTTTGSNSSSSTTTGADASEGEPASPSASAPTPGLYQSLVARAQQQIKHYEKTGRMLAGTGSSVFGVFLPPESVDLDAEWEEEQRRLQLQQHGSGESSSIAPDSGTSATAAAAAASRLPHQQHYHHAPPPQADDFGQRRSCWISEIEVDVKRTYVVDRGFDLRKGLSEKGSSSSSTTTTSNSSSSTTPISLSNHHQESGQDDIITLREEAAAAIAATPGGAGLVHQESMTEDELHCREVQRRRLSRVLQAFAMYNPRLKYCQGMNMCTAILLKVTDNDEEAAFWLLVGLCERCLMEEMWMEGMPRLKACFAVLDRLLHLRTPALHAHFEEAGVHVAMFSSKWFVTLFSNLDTLPLQTVLRVWDVFFLEGWSVIFGVAVSLIEMLESQLKDLELEDVLRVMQDPRRALRELLLTQDPTTAQMECCDGQACVDEEGAGPLKASGAATSMSAMLMRRGSAISQGAQAFAEVEEKYNL